MIADIIHAKSLCQFSHYNKQIIDLPCLVCTVKFQTHFCNLIQIFKTYEGTKWQPIVYKQNI